MRILITGGNGYVGREAVALLAPEHEVCVLDNLRYGRVRLRQSELERIRLERADITDRGAVERVVRSFRPEAVIHLAAIHYIPECEADPSAALLTNVFGTMNLLLACEPGCRFVFASSGAVYKPAAEPHSEAGEVKPSDIYGFTKLHGEEYVRHIAGQRGLSAVVVRLFNVIGPGETNPHLVPEIVAQLKCGRVSIRLGNIWPKRDYVHVLDAARGFVATALNSDVPPGETVTVNLGTSRSYSVASVLRKLRRIAGIRFALERDDSRVRAVDRPFLAADNSLIQRVFGWRPEHTIEDALTELWRDPDLPDSLLARYR
ncbi:NAD-dependent epimerase/dehydratase family protein [Enterovirga aerilata]|uniref:UDP-glucose 4-epimerase n=1 Tax=Enterovirga aerilata TaxID=2730920 RepID=A0A849I8G8_9HYPH|nr:NAD-dependent epimerase/dehydratase family protein [Enterovirga sp. DB1703]NNM74084.1 UDP-glucose 4-epimerase [Enterovirga sp. DB1703]